MSNSEEILVCRSLGLETELKRKCSIDLALSWRGLFFHVTIFLSWWVVCLGLPRVPSGSHLMISWLSLSCGQVMQWKPAPSHFNVCGLLTWWTIVWIGPPHSPGSIFSSLPFPKDCNLPVTSVSFLARMQELGVEWRALELKPAAVGSSLTAGMSAMMRQDDVLMLMSALACLNCVLLLSFYCS